MSQITQEELIVSLSQVISRIDKVLNHGQFDNVPDALETKIKVLNSNIKYIDTVKVQYVDYEVDWTDADAARLAANQFIESN